MLKKLLLLSTLACASLTQAKEFIFENKTDKTITIHFRKTKTSNNTPDYAGGMVTIQPQTSQVWENGLSSGKLPFVLAIDADEIFCVASCPGLSFEQALVNLKRYAVRTQGEKVVIEPQDLGFFTIVTQ